MSEISQLLQRGLQSLAQGDDSTAFQHLTQVMAALEQAGMANSSDGWKAQMGLVMLHQRAGNLTIARDLAQSLSLVRNSKVSEWAKAQLVAMVSDRPKVIDGTEPTHRNESSSTDTDQPASQDTGFVAFDENAPRPERRRRLKSDGAMVAFGGSEDFQTDSANLNVSADRATNVVPDMVFDPAQPYDRSTQWSPLKETKSFNLPLMQVLTIAGLVGIPAALIGGLQWSAQILGSLRNKLPFLGWQQPMAIEIPWVKLTLLAIGAIALSPWIIRWQLNRSGKVKNLSTSQLSQYSPEAYRVLQRGCKGAKITFPHLEIIETDLPLVLSYGVLPLHQTIAVSRAVLERFQDGEIATLYAIEVNNLANWTTAILASTTTLALLPHIIYWECSKLSDRFLTLALEPQSLFLLPWIWKIAGLFFATIAAISYGVFAFLRWMGFGLSRSRSEENDRAVCNLTGNPNGLASSMFQLRSLTADAMVQPSLATNGATFILEGFENLLPVSLRDSATVPLRSVESWWAINQSQPPTETRLINLGAIASHWNLTPLFSGLPSSRPLSSGTKRLTGLPSQSVRTWATPLVWAISGYGLAWLAWGLGWILYWIGQRQLAWLGSDYSLFLGLPMIGFGMGTWMRFNRFFPELSSAMSRCDRSNLNAAGSEALNVENAALIHSLTQTNAIPLKPHMVMLQGKLQGRSGVGNWLGQDLWLEMASGDRIKLHVGASLGPIGLGVREFFGNPTLSRYVGQEVMISGWLRRGATIWMDVEAARTNGGVLSGGHQVWSILIGGLFVGIGLFILL
jgi:Zn-dependent protease with chaperone function